MIHQTVRRRGNVPRRFETSQEEANQCVPGSCWRHEPQPINAFLARVRGQAFPYHGHNRSYWQRKNAGPTRTEEWKAGGDGGRSHKASCTVETPSALSRNFLDEFSIEEIIHIMRNLLKKYTL